MPSAYAIFVVLGFLLLILGIVFAAGLIILIVGLIVRYRALKAKKKRVLPKVLIGLSLPLLLIPLILVAIPTVPVAVRVIQDPDLIKSERTKYSEDVLEFFEAADRRDEEAMYELLAPSTKKIPNIREQIKEFLVTYQGPPETLEKDFRPSSYWETIDGDDVVICSDLFGLELDGEQYFCSISVAFPRFGESGKYGITSVTLWTASAFDSENIDFPEEDGVYVFDYEIRWIDGLYHKFELYDRVITEQKMIDFFAVNKSLDEFIERFGEPNVYEDDYCCVYEVTREDGSLLYAKIYLNSVDHAESGHFCDEDGTIDIPIGEK